MKHILSFDIAKGKSVYCFIDEKRNVIRDATLIEHKKDEFDELRYRVQELEEELRKLKEYVEEATRLKQE